MVAAGTIYRVSLPDRDSEGLFGREPEQKATTASLMMGGLALIVVGVVWSATTPHCQHDEDCWSRDRCDTVSNTCVPRSPETQLEAQQGSRLVISPPLALSERFRPNTVTPFPLAVNPI